MKPYKCLKMGIEPMNILKVWMETISKCLKTRIEPITKMFRTGNRTHVHVESVYQNHTNVCKRDSNPWICWKVESKLYKCSKIGVEPWTIGKVWKVIRTCERIDTTGSRTHDMCMATIVLNLLLRKNVFYFFYTLFWVVGFSIMGLLQVLSMKLVIFYMDTINLIEFHCTGVWEVYSWTIYQRLALWKHVWRRSVFYAAQKKREKFENPV